MARFAIKINKIESQKKYYGDEKIFPILAILTHNDNSIAIDFCE